MMRYQLSRLSRAAAFAAFLMTPMVAQASSPAELEAEITGALGEYHQARQIHRSTPLSETGEQRQLTLILQARQRAEERLSSALVRAIARHPARHAELVARAVAAAPEFRTVIVEEASESFPQYQGSIAAAGTLWPATVWPATGWKVDGIDFQAASAQRPAARKYLQFASNEVGNDGNVDEDLGLDDLGEIEDLNDPIEPLNRFFFVITDAVDTIVLRPLAVLYGFVMPERGKRSVRNAFRNLNEPRVFANKLLQAEFEGAGIAVGRLLVNTTVGVAGLFEVADEWGMPRQTADFGQTLYTYGIGPGPHVFVPILGPHSSRHAVGRVGDIVMDPMTWLLPSSITLPLAAGNAVTTRETLIEPLDALREGSVDYYTALRAAYYQNRLKTLRGEQGDEFDPDQTYQDPPQN